MAKKSAPADELEEQKARFYEIEEEREKLQAQIAQLQAPLVEDRQHPDRAKVIEKLKPLREKMITLAKEHTNLGRALSGKL